MQKTGDSLRPAIDKCFTDNGCEVPAKEERQPKPDEAKREQCRKDFNAALKLQVQNCVRQKAPGFTFPPGNQQQEHREGGKFRANKKEIEKACGNSADKAKTVEGCIKQAGSKVQLTEQQRKDRFDKNCQEKNQCLTSLGNCKVQLDLLKKTMCDCNQSVRTEANISTTRGATASCAGLKEEAKGKKGQEQRSCDQQQQDWCQKGYDAWKADQAQHKKGGHQ